MAYGIYGGRRLTPQRLRAVAAALATRRATATPMEPDAARRRRIQETAQSIMTQRHAIQRGTFVRQ